MARLYKSITCSECPKAHDFCSSKCSKVPNYKVDTLQSGMKVVIWTEDLDVVILDANEVKELAKALGLKIID